MSNAVPHHHHVPMRSLAIYSMPAHLSQLHRMPVDERRGISLPPPPRPVDKLAGAYHHHHRTQLMRNRGTSLSPQPPKTHEVQSIQGVISRTSQLMRVAVSHYRHHRTHKVDKQPRELVTTTTAMAHEAQHSCQPKTKQPFNEKCGPSLPPPPHTNPCS